MRSVAAVIAFVACAHAGLWAVTRERVAAPDVTTQLASVSYAPFGGSAHPDTGQLAQEAQIRSDLRKLSPLTRSVRTYSSTGGVELVPRIANEFGLRVTAGAWIDKFADRNEREADRWAADLLVDPEHYAALEREGADIHTIAEGLDVTMDVVDAFQAHCVQRLGRRKQGRRRHGREGRRRAAQPESRRLQRQRHGW